LKEAIAMSDPKVFPVVFDGLPPERREIVARLYMTFGRGVLTETRAFVDQGEPIAEEVAAFLDTVPPPVADALGRLVAHVQAFHDRLAEADAALATVLEAAVGPQSVQ
jgi:hypothetical protein